MQKTSPLKIGAYRPEQKEAAIELWRRCGLVVPQNDPAEDIARKANVNPEWFLVGLMDGKLVATCMAGYEGHRGWINYLAVSPDYQRRGIARQMMQAAQRLLRKAGCPKINLQVRESNAEALAFYRRLGYTQDAVVSMGKRLVVD